MLEVTKTTVQSIVNIVTRDVHFIKRETKVQKEKETKSHQTTTTRIHVKRNIHKSVPQPTQRT